MLYHIVFKSADGYLGRFDTQSPCDARGLPLEWGYGDRSESLGFGDVLRTDRASVEVLDSQKKAPDLFWSPPWALLMSNRLAATIQRFSIAANLRLIPTTFQSEAGHDLFDGVLLFSGTSLEQWLMEPDDAPLDAPSSRGDLGYFYKFNGQRHLWFASERLKKECEQQDLKCIAFQDWREM